MNEQKCIYYKYTGYILYMIEIVYFCLWQASMYKVTKLEHRGSVVSNEKKNA